MDRGALADLPPRGEWSLRQLPGGGRGGPGARGIPAGHLRASRRDQAALRPRQPLPVQSERPASSIRPLVGGRRYCGWISAEIAQRLEGAVAAGRAEDGAARPRTGPAEIEAVDRSAVV